MGLFDRLKRGPEAMPANVEPGWAEGSEWREQWDMPLNLVREGYYQEALVRLCGRVRAQGYLIPVESVLVREPQNPHDRNAIRVEVRGAMVGHIRREVAAVLGPALDRMRLPSMTVCAVIRGGGPEWENLGIHLWMDRRLSPGPGLEFSGDLAIVTIGWPPHDGEGDHSYVERR